MGRQVAPGDSYVTGDWVAARDGYESTPGLVSNPDALDGLGRTLWWLNEPAAGMGLRAQAYALYRRSGRAADAGAIAVWLAREHRALLRSPAVADGWLARAKTIASELGPTPLDGWTRLAESESTTGSEAIERAEEAVAIARRHADRDLEIASLASLGASRVALCQVDVGLGHLHEAMVAATAGEGRDPQVVAEALCVLLEVSTWLGDLSHLDQWAGLLEEFNKSYEFGPLLPFSPGSGMEVISSFCEACCGAVYVVTGRLDSAEEELVRAVARLQESGVHPRCAHPAAQLAELRLAQGRLEEADTLLSEVGDDPDCVLAAAALELARGRPESAVQRLEGALADMREPLRALPLQVALVEAALATGDRESAGRASLQVDRIAASTRSRLHEAFSLLCRGRLSAVEHQDDAVAQLRGAAQGFARAGASLPACQARLALAEACVESDASLAITEARAALLAFDRMGASAWSDRAAALLRRLGVRGRPGPRSAELLTRREQDVLRLVSQGMSNNEIAERLVISPKTAGNHVSSILLKLGLRSRTEAAAFAVVHQMLEKPHV